MADTGGRGFSGYDVFSRRVLREMIFAAGPAA
jgi:hypothetical protein